MCLRGHCFPVRDTRERTIVGPGGPHRNRTFFGPMEPPLPLILSFSGFLLCCYFRDSAPARASGILPGPLAGADQPQCSTQQKYLFLRSCPLRPGPRFLDLGALISPRRFPGPSIVSPCCYSIVRNGGAHPPLLKKRLPGPAGEPLSREKKLTQMWQVMRAVRRTV